MQLALNNRSKTMFKFGLPSIVAYSPKNITVPRSVRPTCRFLQDSIAKISVTSPIVINMPTRELLAGETKNSFV